MKASINQKEQKVVSIRDLSDFLDEIDQQGFVEAWLYFDTGSSICLLKNREKVFLMYLKDIEDEGTTSIGDEGLSGLSDFRLSNGQIDQYPNAWCIDSEYALKGLAYFHQNEGIKSEYIQWQKSIT